MGTMMEISPKGIKEKAYLSGRGFSKKGTIN
jgi:hypothetical protein